MCHMHSPNQEAKLAMLLLLALLLLSNGVANVYCSTVHDNSVDLHALLDFHRGINDPKEALSNWRPDTHFCRWKGVNCTTTRPFRVSSLNLTGLNLEGQITSSLGNLTFLKTLDLSNNNLLGGLPLLGNLKKLQTLYLYSNQLQGIIPDSLANCSNLSDLDLSSNHLEGAIPPKLDSLSNLFSLNLAGNNLTGTIPPTLGNITTLKAVSLSTNQLQGSIPDKLWQLPKMSALLLSFNRLSGEIPKTLHNKTSLQVLSLSYNMLGNVLPPNIGDTFPNLASLELDSNRFEGQIPASLANASQLNSISLASNNFTGPVPSSLGKLSKLSLLNLQVNNLEATDSQGWEFLHALRNCKLLVTLSLANNHLQGVIPNSIGDLSLNLQTLLLGRNKLSGAVPPSIGNLRGLNRLILHFNNLNGTIGEWVGKLVNLQGLQLGANNFTGSIPSSIGHLTKLTRLGVASNALEGPIPFSLGNLSGLLELDLSHNSIQGIIPPEISNLKQLINLDLSANKLTGEIPDAFGDLMSLDRLNLSRNNLSGTIPTTLNGLLLLIKLDLSYNRLQGEIPMTGVFANATVVSLEGNIGLCGGVKDLHMPSCKSAPRRTGRQYYLVRILIPIFGFMSLILVLYLLILLKKKTRGEYVLSPSFGENFLKVSYNDLAQATKNFSEINLVGRGSYGSVYRAKLKEYALEVAVKVFDLEMRGAERSFMSECEALRSIQHRNLLPILTACSTVDYAGNVFKALVYEYMPNGNLDNWIHHKEDDKAPKRLGLSQTISICVNIADALDYLHHECGKTIIHCDLKPSNILLADDMNALLADFGIARFYMDSSSTSAGSTSSVGVKGTIGYIPPEYAGGGHPSTSGDVYGFGIVLLELMTGKRPTDPMFKDGLDIVNFVRDNFPDQILEVIDGRLTEDCKGMYQTNMTPGTGNAVYQCLLSLLQVALSCTHLVPSERMSMKQIAHIMHGVKTSYLGWKAEN